MQKGSKFKWKPLSKLPQGTAENLRIREEDHGKGPFIVKEIEPFLENNRLIIFRNERGHDAVVNENLLIEV